MDRQGLPDCISRDASKEKIMHNVVGHRGRMRDHAVILYKLLTENRRLSIVRIAEELGTSKITARRWVDCFSCVLPLRIERGVVINDRQTKGT